MDKFPECEECAWRTGREPVMCEFCDEGSHFTYEEDVEPEDSSELSASKVIRILEAA